MAYTERYVSVSGGGLHDGTSEENAWTWSEMSTNHSGATRINIKSGSYGTVAGFTAQAGTAPTLTVFRGYNTTIGDLENQGRNSDGTLNITNFPVIVLSSFITPSIFVVFQNISFTGSPSNGLIYSSLIDNFMILKCSLVYGGTGWAVRGDNGLQVIDSDCECTASPTVIDGDRYLLVDSCRVKGGTGTGNVIHAQEGSVMDSIILGSSTSIGVSFTSTEIVLWLIKNNTIYGLGTGIQLPNSLQLGLRPLINNHITDCSKKIDILYSTTANTAIVDLNSRTRDNTTPETGVGDGVKIGEVTTDTGGAETDFVDYANGDFTLISAAPAVDAGMGM